MKQYFLSLLSNNFEDLSQRIYIIAEISLILSLVISRVETIWNGDAATMSFANGNDSNAMCCEYYNWNILRLHKTSFSDISAKFFLLFCKIAFTWRTMLMLSNCVYSSQNVFKNVYLLLIFNSGSTELMYFSVYNLHHMVIYS